jgi:phage shock protein PspC (stress-responsive transcriptional regulator)
MARGNGIKRSTDKAIFGGVCAGFAEHYGWSLTGTRVVYVLLSVLSAAFPGILVYLIFWLVLPKG